MVVEKRTFGKHIHIAIECIIEYDGKVLIKPQQIFFSAAANLQYNIHFTKAKRNKLSGLVRQFGQW